MGTVSSLPTERSGLTGVINSQLANNTALTSTWVDMANYRRLRAILGIGAIDTTIDAKLQEATDNAGTGAKDIAGKAITQLGATDDNKQVELNLRSDEMDTNNDFQFVALVVTIGNGATGANIAAFLESWDVRYNSASQFDLATVAEIVN